MDNFQLLVIMIAFSVIACKLISMVKDVEVSNDRLESTIMQSKKNSFKIDDFNKYMEVLNFFIDKEFERFELFTLRPTKTVGYTIINDELFSKWRYEIVLNITNSISSDIEEYLSLYIRDYDEYIVEIVNVKLTELLIRSNLTIEQS